MHIVVLFIISPLVFSFLLIFLIKDLENLYADYKEIIPTIRHPTSIYPAYLLLSILHALPLISRPLVRLILLIAPQAHMLIGEELYPLVALVVGIIIPPLLYISLRWDKGFKKLIKIIKKLLKKEIDEETITTIIIVGLILSLLVILCCYDIHSIIIDMYIISFSSVYIFVNITLLLLFRFSNLTIKDLLNTKILGKKIAQINSLELASIMSTLLLPPLIIADKISYIPIYFVVILLYTIMPLAITVIRMLSKFINNYDRLFTDTLINRLRELTEIEEKLILVLGTDVEPLITTCREILITDQKLEQYKKAILIKRGNQLEKLNDFIPNLIIVTTEDTGNTLMEVTFNFGTIGIYPLITRLGTRRFIPIITLNKEQDLYSEELLFNYLQADKASTIYLVEEKNPKLFRELKEIFQTRTTRAKILLGAPHSYELPSIVAEHIDYFDITPTK